MQLKYHPFTSQNGVNYLIYENRNTLQYAGKCVEITNERFSSHLLFVMDTFCIPDDIGEHTALNHGYRTSKFENIQAPVYRTKTGLSTVPHDKSAFIQSLLDGDIGFTVITEEELDDYKQQYAVAESLIRLYAQYPVYKQIYYNGELCSLLDILKTLPNQEDYFNQLAFANNNTSSNIKPIQDVAERILNDAQTKQTYHLMTQEEQIEFFLMLNKKRQRNHVELVPDVFIDALKASQSYQRICDKLLQAGFALSNTQQNNSLQHTGLLMNHQTQRVLYNLSDMGAGKTLMTVESILLAQDLMIDQTLEQIQAIIDRGEGETLERIKKYQLPNINLIVPLLSVQSSWIKTFQIFVDVSKVSSNHYQYVIERDGYQFHGEIYISGFTVKAGNLHVDEKLPTPSMNNHDFLIIDEIHQFVHRPVKASRFIQLENFRTLDVYKNYRTFVLSGTLSNLSVKQWFYLIGFLNIPNSVWAPHGFSTPRDFESGLNSLYNEVRENMKKMAQTIEPVQHRIFDPSDVQTQVALPSEKMTYKELYFNKLYGANILEFKGDENSLADMKYLLTTTRTSGYEQRDDVTIHATTNFKLFYNIVSKSVVTAQSEQIAEELFGKQQTQHKAQIIKIPSQFNKEDIALLKRIYQLIENVDKYKSPRIAMTIANHILNLNDGLVGETVYDVLNRFASQNTRFLEYLTSLNLDLLESIQQSNLIHSPILEETRKFQVVKELLEKEKEETFLIVVNDAKGAIKLAKALGVKPLTKKQMTDDLSYQETLDELYTQQNIVVVPQHMIKSSLDLVQANRLIQYQLNTDISDIIQTQNRINRIGQTRETKAYYIATDVLQEQLIELFLETYRNIKVAHKGIVELFVDMEKQIDVVSDYLSTAFKHIDNMSDDVEDVEGDTQEEVSEGDTQEDNVEVTEEVTEEVSEEVSDVEGDTQEEIVEEVTEEVSEGDVEDDVEATEEVSGVEGDTQEDDVEVTEEISDVEVTEEVSDVEVTEETTQEENCNSTEPVYFVSNDRQVQIALPDTIVYDGIVIWYQNQLLVKNDKGQAVSLTAINEQTTTPIVGVITQGKVA